MKLYLWAITALSGIFLIRMQIIHWTEILDKHSNLEDATLAARVGLEALLDAIGDTTKYLLIAICGTCVSTLIYIEAIRRPARWKTWVLFVGGLAWAWAAHLIQPEDFVDTLILSAALIIGHIQWISGAVLFLRIPVWEAAEVEEGRQRLAPIKASIDQLCKTDSGFRSFFGRLSEDERFIFPEMVAYKLENAKSGDVIKWANWVKQGMQTTPGKYDWFFQDPVRCAANSKGG